MAALYFAVAANVLRQVIEQNDGRFVFGLFGGLIDVATIRHCVKTIDENLNYTNRSITTAEIASKKFENRWTT